MIRTGIGIGTGDDAYKAGLEACDELTQTLPMGAGSAVLVFSSVSFDQDRLLEAIKKRFPDAEIVGCSTAGEISSDGLSAERSVVVMGITSDQLKFYSSAGHHILWNPKEAGAQVAGDIQYRSHGYVRSALLFLDVISGRGEEVVEGAYDRFGNTFPIFGAAAGDDLLFFETYQYHDGKVYSGSVVGLGIAGKYSIGFGNDHGFLPIGVKRLVTRAEGTTLYEIDGRPAVDIYKEYFGEEYIPNLREELLSGIAVSYPLGVTMPGKNERVLRNPIFIDSKGAITFTANIPVGSEVRIMLSGKEEILASAERAAKQALKGIDNKKPAGAIVIDSIARKKLLGGAADEEIRVIQQTIGRDVPIAGFYGYAQVGGVMESGMLPFHNAAISVILIAE